MAETRYDVVPYTSYPFADTHPDRLRLVAHLFHVAAAPAEACRVLEIGCSSGGNLIPMAEAFPESRFVGIDLAGSAIAEGQETIAALGLGNIELRQGDLAAFPEGAGEFDYIIAHGVYSWVPAPIKAALLDVVARHLAPTGVAFVSHNVKPGWFARVAAREMMLFHAGDVADPPEQASQARALLGFVARAAQGNDWQPLVRVQFELASRQPDWLLLHDYLGTVNDGCWFHEIVGEVDRRGLAYLGDADLATMLPDYLAKETLATLGRIASDQIRHEQYLDFLTNRAFRMTLVVRGDAQIDRSLSAAQVSDLHFTGILTEGSDGKFRAAAGGEITAGGDIARAALRALAKRAPASLDWSELRAAAGASGPDADQLAADVLQLCLQTFVDPALTPGRCVAAAGPRPKVAAHVRHAARRGRDHVTSLRHTNVRISQEVAVLLQHLDGTNDREELQVLAGLPGPSALDAALAVLAERGLLMC